MSYFSFKRPHLAIAYCDSLEGKGISNATSGLFIAGPRRVGKSTFLQEDLMPEAQKRGWTIVYVDLWADKNAEPAFSITESIKTAIAHHQNNVKKLAKTAKLDKINIMGTFVLDLSKPGFPDNMTLTDGLKMLKKISKGPVLLIIDEAQHTLTSTAGMNAMFAIKSARDQMNTSDTSPSLMLVLTGSNRDKLAHLVLKKDQPFFGSDITAFPLLGRDYTDAFTLWLNQKMAGNNQFRPDSLWEAFQLVGHRPEVLRQIAGNAAINGTANQLSELLKEDAHIWQTRLWKEFETDFNALTPLQQTVLKELAHEGRAFSPFSEEAIARYKKALNQTDISTSSVQSAIQQLRERGFIWQSNRGAYALEDESVIEWLNHGTS